METFGAVTVELAARRSVQRAIEIVAEICQKSFTCCWHGRIWAGRETIPDRGAT